MTDSLPPLVDTIATRLTLHHLAEQVLSAEQVAANGEFRLDATPDGFATRWFSGPDQVTRRIQVAGIDLLRETNHGTTRVPIEGDIDIAAAAVLYAWWDLGTRTLTAVAATYGERSSDIVLYPEHFDVGSTLDLDTGKLNLGFSPGDDFCAAPYVYAGPWETRTGEFWNAPFGAYRRYDEIDQAQPETSVRAFLDTAIRTFG
jgi:hypothetical protein